MLARNVFIVVVIYTILFFILTFPLLTQFSTSYYHEGGDSWLFVWNHWWMHKQVSTGGELLWTDYLYYPEGVNLAFHSWSYYSILLAVPLLYLFSPIVTFNLISALTFILAGLGGYLLCYHVTRNRFASFVGGYIFAFSPHHMLSTGSLNVLSIMFIPFFILYFLKLWDGWWWRDVILSALFFALIALSSWYYMIFMSMFLIFFFVYKACTDRKELFNVNNMKKIIVTFCLALLLLFPFVYPMLAGLGGAQNKSDIVAYVTRSVDLAGLVVPSYAHPVFGKYVTKFYLGPIDGIFTDRNHIAYLGISSLILAAIGVMTYRKQSRFWLTAFIVMLILSMGPALHFMGLVTIPVDSSFGLEKFFAAKEPNLENLAYTTLKDNIGIPLPYALVYFTPVFQMARAPSRLLPFVILMLAVLAALGMKAIISQKNRIRALLIASLVFILLVFEFATLPPLQSPRVPDFYYELAQEEGDFAILQFPQNYGSAIHNMYYQTIHGKRTMTGATSRGPPTETTTIPSNYAVEWLLDPVTEFDGELFTMALQSISEKYNFRYIIVDRTGLEASEEYVKTIETALEQTLQKRYKDDTTLVVELP